MGRHDLSYRLFFAHRRMIQDLLREIVGEGWVERADLDSCEQVNGSFVSERHQHRESDVIWKFRRRDSPEPLYIYVLMEFQSRPDPTMPVRLMTYVSLFYQSLMTRGLWPATGKLPLVIPVVLYNGWERWNVPTDLGSMIEELDPSAEIYRPQLRYRLVDEGTFPRERLEELNNPVSELFRIDQSRDLWEVHASVGRLRRMLPPSETTLRRAFTGWLREIILRRFPGWTLEIPEAWTLEDIETMLAENIDRWNRQIREEGREEGRQEGEAKMLLRQLRLKFGPLSPEVEERVRSTGAERLLEWSDRVLTAGQLSEVFAE